jgi:hypothetical protein
MGDADSFPCSRNSGLGLVELLLALTKAVRSGAQHFGHLRRRRHGLSFLA